MLHLLGEALTHGWLQSVSRNPLVNVPTPWMYTPMRAFAIWSVSSSSFWLYVVRPDCSSQLACGERIFYWLSVFEVREKVEKNIRPRRPRSTPRSFYKLMEKCWQHEPEKRISMNNVLAYFGIDSSAVLDPRPLFKAQARQSCAGTSRAASIFRETKAMNRSFRRQGLARAVVSETGLDRGHGLS
jgi:hypothetical protein